VPASRAPLLASSQAPDYYCLWQKTVRKGCSGSPLMQELKIKTNLKGQSIAETRLESTFLFTFLSSQACRLPAAMRASRNRPRRRWPRDHWSGCNTYFEGITCPASGTERIRLEETAALGRPRNSSQC